MKHSFLLSGACALLVLAAQAQEFSVLWGRDGEAWDPAGRLPDVSFAGYACGERPLPRAAVTADVRDFGAKGDGTPDDSAAFLAAIAKAGRGAIFIPPGRYRITRILEITRPGIVLRGAGPERSVLVCPLPLETIKPNMGTNSGGRPTSEYSWGGGIVSFNGRDPGKSIGHFTELGFNAVAFAGVADCWARNLLITNADSAIFASGNFCTIEGLRCQTRDAEELNGVFGHHGVSLTGDDNLFTRFEIRQRFIHDITVSGGAGNVSSSGSGTDLSFDHHKRAPYDNVFSDIDLGTGSRMWMHGGGKDLGWPCGARGTFWNIRAKQAQNYPTDFGPPSINRVGVQTREKSVTDPAGRWFEVIAPERLQPANLHEAQWLKRLGAK